MARKILTVGVDLASDEVAEEDFESKASLLDWDIVLFRPSIEPWISRREQYLGKPSLSDSESFQIKEACEHWRREIKQAVESGKTVVVFLSELTEVYIDTGRREYSGTGRNRATTRIVDLFSNYKSLPVDLQPINSSGTSVKLVAKGAELFAPYWAEFGPLSEYKVLLQTANHPPILQTKSGERTVGVCVRSKSSGGAFVCVPDIDFYRSEFLEITDDDEGTRWTPAAHQFCARLIASVVALDAALRSSGEVTPEPAWASEPNFALASEIELRSQLLEVETRLEQAQRQKEEVQRQILDAGSLRGLLYEKGKPLESAIIAALTLLGFEAKPFQESGSEFDVVFESSEGRLIGEAEGKDSKPINVDKLRQLAMNLHEDLQREEVTVPAKGVLFGNPYRLLHPTERTEPPFTDKCVAAAVSNGTALIETRQLFVAAQYMIRAKDIAYAASWRSAVLKGTGLLSLPVPPGPGDETTTAAKQ
jgi:hypothetical protein